MFLVLIFSFLVQKHHTFRRGGSRKNIKLSHKRSEIWEQMPDNGEGDKKAYNLIAGYDRKLLFIKEIQLCQ
jgi:hypothetical protein